MVYALTSVMIPKPVKVQGLGVGDTQASSWKACDFVLLVH